MQYFYGSHFWLSKTWTEGGGCLCIYREILEIYRNIYIYSKRHTHREVVKPCLSKFSVFYFNARNVFLGKIKYFLGSNEQNSMRMISLAESCWIVTYSVFFHNNQWIVSEFKVHYKLWRSINLNVMPRLFAWSDESIYRCECVITRWWVDCPNLGLYCM